MSNILCRNEAHNRNLFLHYVTSKEHLVRIDLNCTGDGDLLLWHGIFLASFRISHNGKAESHAMMHGPLLFYCDPSFSVNTVPHQLTVFLTSPNPEMVRLKMRRLKMKYLLLENGSGGLDEVETASGPRRYEITNERAAQVLIKGHHIKRKQERVTLTIKQIFLHPVNQKTPVLLLRIYQQNWVQLQLLSWFFGIRSMVTDLRHRVLNLSLIKS